MCIALERDVKPQLKRYTYCFYAFLQSVIKSFLHRVRPYQRRGWRQRWWRLRWWNRWVAGMWKISSQILHMINLIKETVVREEVCATLYSNTWVHTCISWFFRQHSSWILAVYVTDYSSTSVITYYRTTWRCIRQYDSTVFRQKRRGSPQMMRPTHWGELVSGPKRIQYGNKTCLFFDVLKSHMSYTRYEAKHFFADLF